MSEQTKIFTLPNSSNGGVQGVCIGGKFHGWLMRKHPDGQWVSLAKLEAVDPWADDPNKDLYAALSPASDARRTEGETDQRMFWFLTVLEGMGGHSDASDSPHCWVQAFCDDRDDDTDTFNLATQRKFTRTTHDDRFDTSDVHLNEAGRSWLAHVRSRTPAPQAADAVRVKENSIQSDSSGTLRSPSRSAVEER